MEKSYYAIIPANVRYDADLTPNAKLLYGEITALCNEKGYCWAKNEYFAGLYNTSEKTITRWIKNLTDKGYIETEVKTFRYDDGTVKKIRYVFIDKNVRNQQEIIEQNHTDKNVPNHTDKNEAYNNTPSNNTNSNNKKERKTSYDEIIAKRITDEDLKGLIYDFIKMRNMKKKPLTDRALTIQLNKLAKLGADIEEQKQIVEKSIVKCWDEFYPLRKEADNGLTKSSNGADGAEYSIFS
jgi:DNA-binding PadR family transcriptional regulator